MPEHVDKKTGKRLYHENETTLNIEKTVLGKFEPKSGKGPSSYMHRDSIDEDPMDVDRTLDDDGKLVLQPKSKLSINLEGVENVLSSLGGPDQYNMSISLKNPSPVPSGRYSFSRSMIRPQCQVLQSQLHAATPKVQSVFRGILTERPETILQIQLSHAAIARRAPQFQPHGSLQQVHPDAVAESPQKTIAPHLAFNPRGSLEHKRFVYLVHGACSPSCLAGLQPDL